MRCSYALGLLSLTQECIRQCEAVKVDANILSDIRAAHGNRVAERSGEFKWATLRDESGNIHMKDVSDFIADINVEARGKGQRVVVTGSDMEFGQLLLVEKAMLMTNTEYKHDCLAMSHDYSMLDTLGDTAEIGPMIAQSLIADPSKYAVLESLHPPPFRHSPILKESKRLEMIRRGLPEIDLDLVRRKVLAMNTELAPEGAEAVYRAIYGVSHLLSHSCLPNSVVEVIGDVSQTPLLG